MIASNRAAGKPIVTLKEIAQAAGVSVRTVSVVLNGKASEGRISEALARKVQQIADKHNYRPNALARAIRTKKTFQIGLLHREISNPNTGRTIEYFERLLVQHGYKILLGLTNGQLELAEGYLSEFSRGMVDGILNFDPNADTETFRRLGVRVPFINVQRPSPGFDLRINWDRAITLVYEHLRELGHRRIGFLCGPRDDISSHARLQTFSRLFHRDNRRKGSKEPIHYGDWSFESGLELAPQIAKHPYTAIIGANDMMAIGVMKGLHLLGINVPNEISVTGIDDTYNARMVTPSLTSVSVHMNVVAELTSEALLKMIAGEQPHRPPMIEPTLSVRESSIAPKAD